MTTITQSIQQTLQSFNCDTNAGRILVSLLALILSYLTPIAGLLFACFSCSIIDMYYGIKVAHLKNKKITSHKGWKGTLSKIKDEFILVLLAHLVEYVIIGSPTNYILSGGVTVIITLTELWSIIENLNTINPKGPWKSLGKFLRKKGEDYIGIDLDMK